MELLRTFGPAVWAQALEDWRWCDIEALRPLCTSPFGDMFFEAPDGIWFLDMLEGGLRRAFDDRAGLSAALEGDEGQDEYLLAALALGAERRGLELGPEDVYAFNVAPRLGGPIDVENIGVMPFVVASSIHGQLHRQLKNLPDGTRISGITIDGEKPSKPASRTGFFRRK